MLAFDAEGAGTLAELVVEAYSLEPVPACYSDSSSSAAHELAVPGPAPVPVAGSIVGDQPGSAFAFP